MFVLVTIISVILLGQIDSSSYMKPCSSHESCDEESGLICLLSLCVCVASKTFDHTTDRCEGWLPCTHDFLCRTFDQNSVCQKSGRCGCRDGYRLSSQGKCTKNAFSIDQSCLTSAECSRNERCVDQKCRCDPDYHFNTTTNKCQHFDCRNSHIDCSTIHDPKRECSSSGKGCVCQSSASKADIHNGNKCGDIAKTKMYSDSYRTNLMILGYNRGGNAALGAGSHSGGGNGIGRSNGGKVGTGYHAGLGHSGVSIRKGIHGTGSDWRAGSSSIGISHTGKASKGWGKTLAKIGGGSAFAGIAAAIKKMFGKNKKQHGQNNNPGNKSDKIDVA